MQQVLLGIVFSLEDGFYKFWDPYFPPKSKMDNLVVVPQKLKLQLSKHQRTNGNGAPPKAGFLLGMWSNVRDAGSVKELIMGL